MWTCSNCKEQLEDTFEVCWRCGTTRTGILDPAFAAEAEVGVGPGERPDLECLRCRRLLDFMGVKRFHEGTKWGAIGDIGEFFVRTQAFEAYVCSNCGRVELFAAGVGLGDPANPE